MKKKVLKAEFIPEFETSINEMPGPQSGPILMLQSKKDIKNN